MDPEIAIVGVAAVSGLMQYYNSEQARGANKDQLDKIEAMFNKIVPPDYNVKVWDDPKLVANIPPPALNTNAITPEDYKSVGQYVPQVAEFVKTQNPSLVQNTEAGKQGLSAQLDALDRYKQIAKGGTDPEFQQMQQQAADRAQADAQGRIASTLEGANRRGQLGSGVAMAGQLQGGSDAMQRSALMSQQAATDAYRNKLQAIGSSAQLGGQIQGQDFSQQATNANILNNFNMQTSHDYQQYLQQKAQQANHAQIFNEQNNQRLADANVENRNQANRYNQQYGNEMAQQQFANENLNRQHNIDVQKYKDSLKTQGFQNQMAQAQGQAGIGSMAMQNNRGNAQDQNSAIQGLGNATTSAVMYNDNSNRLDAQEAGRNARYNDYMNRVYPQQPAEAGVDTLDDESDAPKIKTSYNSSPYGTTKYT